MPVTTGLISETVTVNGYFVDGVSFANMAVPFTAGPPDDDGNCTMVVRAYANLEWYSALDGSPVQRFSVQIDGQEFGVLLQQHAALYSLLKIITHDVLIGLGRIPPGLNSITDEERDQIAAAAAQWEAQFTG